MSESSCNLAAAKNNLGNLAATYESPQVYILEVCPKIVSSLKVTILFGCRNLEGEFTCL